MLVYLGYVVILVVASLLAVGAVMSTGHPMVAFAVFAGVLVLGCGAMVLMGIGGDEADADADASGNGG